MERRCDGRRNLFGVLTGLILTLLLAPNALGQPVTTIPATPDPLREQLPVLYVHGFNDDGKGFAINPQTKDATGTAADYFGTLEIVETGQRGLPNYVVQFWAPEGDAFATGQQGWAVLRTPIQIRTPGQNYNSPDPIQYVTEATFREFLPIACTRTGFSSIECTSPVREFLQGLGSNVITTNYNRNGRVEAHAPDLVDLLRAQLGAQGELSGYGQVNFLTASAGGLDVRAALHLLARSPYPSERDRVANVIYAVPPFGGSTAAYYEGLLFSDDLSSSTFSDPWLLNGAGDLTLTELLLVLTRSFVPHPRASSVMQALIEGARRTLENPLFNPAEVKVRDLAGNPLLAVPAVALIRRIREPASLILGFPGVPKSQNDLAPAGAVANLNRWKPNYHTPQFVTWGEGGGRINLSPSLSAAQAAYDTLGNCCGSFLTPQSLSRLPDDWALSNVSARLLATPLGGMKELAGYPDLDHFGAVEQVDRVGIDWAKVFVTPVTELQIAGTHRAVSTQDRYYLVAPGTQFTLRASPRTVRDRNNQSFASTAAAVEYRVVTFPVGQNPVYGTWTSLANNASTLFSTLLAQHDLAGERPFRLDWRAVTTTGAKEAIRSAFFVIDATPPSVVSVEVFSPGIPNSPEILGSSTRNMERVALRGSFLTSRLPNANLPALLGKPETNWIIRNPSNKLLRIDFDEPRAVVRYQWDAFFTDPTVDTLANTVLAFPLQNLTPGPHTLYFETKDLVGNASNVVQSITVLVDDQPPAVALNYEPSLGLDFIVGPRTPLAFVAEDVETNRVEGTLAVPGLPGGTIPVNTTVQLGQTNLAEIGTAAGGTGNFVSLLANVRDAVGNTASVPFSVYYDWTPPQLDLQHVGSSVLTSSGVYRTTASTVRVEVRVTENTGYHPPLWTSTQVDSDAIRSGGPFVFGQQGARPAANGGDVYLVDGVNVVVVTAEDLVGNVGTLTLVIEKVESLIAEESPRPIELLSRRVAGIPPGIGQGPSDVALSDDGSVFAFASARKDHLLDDTNEQPDIFLWRSSGITRVNVSESGAQAAGGPSRNPALSGDGRYVFFASEATNLVAEATTGVNLYVKDLVTGRVSLISRALNGSPANMASAFGRLSFQRVSPTYTGRYVFFDCRFNQYVDGDTNGNSDVFVADLDSDGDGDFFNSAYVIRRVSLGPGGVQGTGGGNTLGSRYPSVSRDGLFVAFETSHTNLFPGDTNGQNDAVLARFAGVSASGAIDFTAVTVVPLNVTGNGTLSTRGGRHPTVDRSGRTVTFVTSGNLLATDANQEGVDSDVYSSTGFIEDWRTRLLRLESTGPAGTAVPGQIAPNHAPTLSDYVVSTRPRVSFLANKAGVVTGDNNGQIDLFVRGAETFEAINWLAPDLPTSQSTLEGGISPNGEWAWWVTAEEYSSVTGAGTGRDLYRRRIDPDTAAVAPVILAQPGSRTVFRGESVAFSVQASARPAPTYRWFFNGQEIEGATGPVLLLAAADFDHAGAYRVQVTNQAGEAMSDQASLAVTSRLPVLTREPAAVEVNEGEPIVLTATGVGLPPLTYRWQRNGVDLENGGRITGAQADTLRISAATLEDAGLYRVIISNLGGSDTSAEVEVTVKARTSAAGEGVPDRYALEANHPNPFGRSTTIGYALPHPGHVRLEVFNLTGQRVALLVDEGKTAGRYSFVFDAGSLSSGLYFYRLTSGSFSETRKLMLLK